jgi:hypothetical protein
VQALLTRVLRAPGWTAGPGAQASEFVGMPPIELSELAPRSSDDAFPRVPHVNPSAGCDVSTL